MNRHSRLDQIVAAALYWFIGAMSGILLLIAGLPLSDGYQKILVITTVLIINGLVIGAKVSPLRSYTRRQQHS